MWAFHQFMIISIDQKYLKIRLYEWVQMSTRCKAANSSQEHDKITDSDDELDLLEKIEQVRADTLAQLVDNSDDSDSDGDELNINKHSTSIEVDDSDDELVSENRITYPFLKDHPLHKTHQAQFNEKKSNVVPNFVGGSLPRCDRATMLALFKPWRAGHDLKSEEDTWDETFNDHEFTAQQKQYIQNFNIRLRVL